MNRLKKLLSVGIGLSVVIIVVMISLMADGANAAGRDENIQKIKDFLNNETAANGLTEKGVSAEKIMGQLDSLSDAQLEKLADNANLQVGGAIEDSEVSDFWKTWGLIIIIATVVPILILLAL